MKGGIGRLAAIVTALLLVSPAVAQAASDESRYSLVHGCFALQSTADGAFVAKSGGSYSATAAGLGAAEPFRMQATALGRYLFYGPAKDFLSLSGSGVAVAADPSNATDLTVDKNGPGGSFTIVNGFNDQQLAVAGNGSLTNGTAAGFNFVETTGCATYPEITTNVEGAPSKGFPRYGETQGMLEAHMHHMAFRFLGGAHCGRPWHRFGVAYALDDCIDHKPDGCKALLDTFLGGEPLPRPDRLARVHRLAGAALADPRAVLLQVARARLSVGPAGLRQPHGRRTGRSARSIRSTQNQECDDSDTVEIELDEAYALQDYIDAQEGGPGKGWYRIVKDPFEAREVINDGKLAVILGVEVSEPFHCRMWMGVPSCNKKQITAEIQHLYDRGVRQMEITNKFDNALTGVAGDNGATGTCWSMPATSTRPAATGTWRPVRAPIPTSTTRSPTGRRVRQRGPDPRPP